MHAPRIASRLLAALLTVTWATLALALLLTPAEGGSRPLLALAALVPALASAAAVVWPVAPDGRVGWAVGWVGVSALLLAIPFVILVGGPLVAGVARPVVLSAGVAYGGLLAVLATTVYAAHAWPQAGLSAHVKPALIGVALTGLVAATGAIAVGSSDPSQAGVPVGCDGVHVAPYARVTIEARAEIDGTVVARAGVSGERSGPDEHWTGTVSGEAAEERTFEYILAGPRAELLTGAGEWQAVDAAQEAISGHLDRRVVSVIAGRGLPPLEDLGVDLVDGAAARHCRISVGGPNAMRAFLPLGWLIGRAPLDRGPALEVWRGDLDWWIFATGQLGRATVLIGGHPADAWTIPGLRGTLRAEMRAVERDVPRTIDDPLP